jgi:acyl transferase domain-containing protein
MRAGGSLFVLPLSADSSSALDRLRAACAALLRTHPDVASEDLLLGATRRRARAWRACAQAPSARALADVLAGETAAGVETGGPCGGAPAPAWAVGGDVPDPTASAALEVALPPFRRVLDACRGDVQATLGRDVRELLAAAPAEPREARVAATVAALGAAEVWRCCAPAPSRVVGVGPGRLAAPCVAGALAPGEAIRLAAGVGEAADVRPRPLSAGLRAPSGIEWLAGTTLTPEQLLDGGADDPSAPAGDLHVHADGARPLPVGVPAGPDALARLVAALGRAFCDGLGVDFAPLLGDRAARAIPLPAPPLERRRVWVRTASDDGPGAATATQLGGRL